MDLACPVLSVSDLTAHVKHVLEADPVLTVIGVRGEISNFKHHTSGHMYFTLKDADAQLPCVMFRGDASRLDFRPADGMDITAFGRIGVYERSGRYQLYVRRMEFGGRGALFEAFEQLKAQLEAEGLFDPRHKKPLPRFPRRVGIISTPTGAGTRDMLTIMRRRYPPAELVLVPSLVQGSEAPPRLIAAVELADALGEFDAIIIGRGGGSIEDLWCFNDEGLARAVFGCRTPIISAVGHETDFTICDFVADVRAPTPSAAAEIVVPDREELLGQFRGLGQRLWAGLQGRSELAGARLRGLLQRPALARPLDRLYDLSQHLDELQDDATRAAQALMEARKASLDKHAARLQALAPTHVMARGYAIVRRHDDGRVLRSVHDVALGDEADVLLPDGTVRTQVLASEEGLLGQSN